jgi:hypothetical protein
MTQKIWLDLDQESFERLAAIAIEERRPIGWQAELLLRRAIANWCTPSLVQIPSEDTANVSA